MDIKGEGDVALLEDLPNQDLQSEEDEVEHNNDTNEPAEEEVETDKTPILEEIDEDETEPPTETKPEMIPGQGPEFSHLNGSYWAMVNEGRTDYCLSIIKHLGNVKDTLSSPQYGFVKGLKVFGKKGYKVTMKELDENLICKTWP